MAAPPARNEISDDYPNPSNAVARVGFGKMWDYMTGLLGLSGDPEDARAALGVPAAEDAELTGEPTAPTPPSSDNSTRIATTAWVKAGFAVLAGATGYLKFPTWLGGLIIQWGVTAVTTDGAGAASITFPMVFPNHRLFTLPWRGVGGGANASILYQTGSASGTAFSVVLRNSSTGAVITGTGVDVCWLAIGD